MSMFGGSTEIRVEPTKRAGGTMWKVSDGVGMNRTFNYKDEAVKAGRRAARDADGTLKIFKTDMSVQETVDY